MFPHLLEGLSVPRIGPGRPRTRPDRLDMGGQPAAEFADMVSLIGDPVLPKLS